jgi:hypothetical protein
MSTKKLSADERKAIIDDLVANCECWKHDGDDKLLSNMPDEKLTQLQEASEKEKETAAVANAALKGFSHDGIDYVYNTEQKGFVCNARPPEDDDEDEEEEDERTVARMKEGRRMLKGESPKKKGKTMTGNETPKTLQEWEATMPQEAAQIWNAAKSVELEERTRLAKQLVSNISDPKRREARLQEYMKKTVPVLREELADRGEQPTANQSSGHPLTAFFGANPVTPFVANSKEEDIGLPPPVYNWEQEQQLLDKANA